MINIKEFIRRHLRVTIVTVINNTRKVSRNPSYIETSPKMGVAGHTLVIRLHDFVSNIENVKTQSTLFSRKCSTAAFNSI